MKKNTSQKTPPPSVYIPDSPEGFIGASAKIAALLARKASELNTYGKGTAKILLYGSPGVGKTRLAEMFASLLAGHPSQVESANGRNVTMELIRQWQNEMRYCPMWGKFSVRIVNEMDTIAGDKQDLLLTFLDELPHNTAFIGTSNLNMNQMTERFQTRMQGFKIEAPNTDDIAAFLQSKWKIAKARAAEIAVGSGGNVRAALMDAQSLMDAQAIA